jgi:membrane protease YdiL (CAAX protease family)
MAFQLGVLALLLAVSRIRGWSIRQLGLHVSWRLTAIGILLFPLAATILVTFTALVLSCVPSSFNNPSPRVVGLSLTTIFAFSIINSLFEETLVCGYIIQRLATKGAAVAICFSAFVRFLYHTYQGPVSLVSLPMGLMFGYLFWRYRQLWPLIVAHSAMDFLSLLLRAEKL